MEKNVKPQIADSAFVAEETKILGDVVIGENSTVLYYTVIRGDEAPIRIGQGTNLQEGCTVHVGEGHPVSIGNEVTVGHNCVIHGCAIGDESLIGMHSTVMDGAVIGKRCLIGAGSLVTGGMRIPDGVLAMGSPARVIRELTREEQQSIIESAKGYQETGRKLKMESRTF